jgi:hypothetical protein
MPWIWHKPCLQNSSNRADRSSMSHTYANMVHARTQSRRKATNVCTYEIGMRNKPQLRHDFASKHTLLGAIVLGIGTFCFTICFTDQDLDLVSWNTCVCTLKANLKTA